ncbi:MAG: septum formation inhibitor Maf [Verrucomicrobiaceae bacterium]|nr:septum formation inhibitor Maf [Verrucomicrobiaceae bacterium]
MREAGYVFEVASFEVEEAYDPSLTCEALTMENARRKAVEGARRHLDALVIGADTLVYIDGHPLSKPADMTEARAMLHRLSGRTHQVCTGVALANNGGSEVTTFATITDVTFKTLNDAAISSYHDLVQVLDKAGGYAVQEHGDLIVERVEGSMSNVIGLPMEALAEHLGHVQTEPC